jgi:hypothetical protein
MKFRVQTQDLIKALEVMSVIPPKVVTGKGESGYLFVVKDGKCYINSRDDFRCIRTEIPVTDSDGDGFFIYPADKISGLKYVDGWVSLEAGHDEKDNRYWVRYETESGASGEQNSHNPSLMKSLDEDLEKKGVEFTFPAALLREGIASTKLYLAPAEDGKNKGADLGHFKTLQLFDKSKPEWEKGDGVLFAADNVRACFFQCSTFCDKGLAIHGRNIPAITSFLAKCEGDITVKVGETMDFIINSAGRVLGWSHHTKQHGQYKYYSEKLDGFAMRVPKEPLVRALRHVRTELGERQDKIRVQYSHENRTLRFQASGGSGRTSSAPVFVEIFSNNETGAGASGEGNDFAANINIDFMLDLVEPVRGHQVELRAALVKTKKESQRDLMLFRTVEEFWLSNGGKVLIAPDQSKDGAHQCRVTRFMPSKD